MRTMLARTCLLASLASPALISPAALLPALAQSDMKTQQVTETRGSVTINWTEGLIQVTGSGSPPDRGNLHQRRLMAERQALTDAFRQLAEVTQSLRVDAETLVRDYTLESPMLKEQVSNLVKNAQRLDTRYLDNGTIEVDLALKLYNSSGLNGILQPQKHIVPPPPVTLEADPQPGDYTGVIVDCRGLGLEAALSPAILAQSGGELYLSELPFDPDYVINQGIVGYAHSLSQARQNRRVGSKPLIIKGLSTSGAYRADVIISDIDTRRLLGLEAQGKVLSQAKVIFVL
ncbi:MAG: hypothetical protein IGS03_13615 [Candidatus Sericytochromatia bacterium]|nr:hypothetical protein [Candidatus Sericytochromatia bacterium]